MPVPYLNLIIILSPFFYLSVFPNLGLREPCFYLFKLLCKILIRSEDLCALYHIIKEHRQYLRIH